VIPAKEASHHLLRSEKSYKESLVMKESSKEILRFWKTQWEAYMKSMMAMQDQGETMLEMIQKSGVLQEGSQKMVREWADKYKVIQKTYLDMVEDHFKKLDDIIGSAP
jgi:phage terminase small subunit